MSKKAARLGVDIGGTFTDVVLEVDGDQYSSKVLTTYSAPEDAIVQGMREVCAIAGIQASSISQMIHGTTLATNALIERSGAHTALITTAGFRDVIEMRTESRFEQYDLNLQLPDPLLPRQQRYTLAERLSAHGEILIPLQRQDIDSLVEEIALAGYQSVAVGFLHSYANKVHEQMVGEVLREKLPDVMVTLSSEVSPQMREYERFNTAVANAYIKPLMASYLGRLQGCLQQQGVHCPIFLMHSGGGIISLESAAEFPVRLVESGPAGGAVFAAHIAASYQLEKVLSFDMGGTTAKICLINQQTPRTSRVFEVARSYRFKKGSGMPISIPVIDMVEIGAGGGSLAYVDSMNQIRVGPESAGSEPGPACYDRGGQGAAVTDADLVMGKLDAENFAGGAIKLDISRSVAALEALGQPLQMNAEMTAYGIAEVVDENMANAARVHAVENGQDLSGYTMIAFGGAAPLHAGRLCEKLGINRLLVPVGAGVGSAIGFLRAPFSFEATRSVYMKLSEFDPSQVKSLFSELQHEARTFVRSCDADAQIQAEFKIYMRYTGQGWEIPIVLNPAQASQATAETFKELFEAEYQLLFSRKVAGIEIEITGWAVNAATPAEPATLIKRLASSQAAAVQNSRPLFDPAGAEFVDADVVRRTQVKPAQTIRGPAVISEDETTIVVPRNCEASGAS